jgi:hypothetical protein
VTAPAEAEIYAGTSGCYCLCHVAHPAARAVCAALSAETTREVNGHAVQMCGPCAAAHDAGRAPAEVPAEVPVAGLAGQLAEHAATMPAEAAEALRACASAIASAWWCGTDDPAEALRAIEANAAGARRLLRPRRAPRRQSVVVSSSPGAASDGPEGGGGALLEIPR